MDYKWRKMEALFHISPAVCQPGPSVRSLMVSHTDPHRNSGEEATTENCKIIVSECKMYQPWSIYETTF